MSSAERIRRWGPPICRDGTADSAEDDGKDDDVEVLDVDPDDEDGLDEDVDVHGDFVLGLNCPTVAMFLTRRMDRAAAQSMKAKVAPFHNFILEHGGALKLCGERQNASTSDAFQTVKRSAL